MKGEWAIFCYAVSHDLLTLEGSCLVQGMWKLLLPTSAQSQEHPALRAPVDLVDPDFEGREAPYRIKLENILVRLSNLYLDLQNANFEIQTLKKNVLSTLYSGTVNCF